MGKKKSALAKVKLPPRVRSELFLALVKRISDHSEGTGFEKAVKDLFGGEAIARSARIVECIEIAYEIGSTEERAMIDEMWGTVEERRKK